MSLLGFVPWPLPPPLLPIRIIYLPFHSFASGTPIFSVSLYSVRCRSALFVYDLFLYTRIYFLCIFRFLRCYFSRTSNYYYYCFDFCFFFSSFFSALCPVLTPHCICETTHYTHINIPTKIYTSRNVNQYGRLKLHTHFTLLNVILSLIII